MDHDTDGMASMASGSILSDSHHMPGDVQWTVANAHDLRDEDEDDHHNGLQLPPGAILLRGMDGSGEGSAGLQPTFVLTDGKGNMIPSLLTLPQDGLSLDQNHRHPLNFAIVVKDPADGASQSKSLSDDTETSHKMDGMKSDGDDMLFSPLVDDNPVVFTIQSRQKCDSDTMGDEPGVHNDPWLGTFEEQMALQKSPMSRSLEPSRSLEGVTEELSPLIESGKMIGEYLEPVVPDTVNSSPAHSTGEVENLKEKDLSLGSVSSVHSDPICLVQSEPAPLKALPSTNHVTYLSHLPVKKRRMDVAKSLSLEQEENERAVASVQDERVVENVQDKSAVMSVHDERVMSVQEEGTVASIQVSAPSQRITLPACLSTGLSTDSTITVSNKLSSSALLSSIASSLSSTNENLQVIRVSMPSPPVSTVKTSAAKSTATTFTVVRSPAKPGSLSCLSSVLLGSTLQTEAGCSSANFTALFCCSICHEEMVSWDKAQLHKYQHPDAAGPPSFLVMYQCSKCKRGFSTWQEAQAHTQQMSVMPVVTCSICAMPVPAQNIQQHLTLHTRQTPDKLSTKLAVQVLKLQKEQQSLAETAPTGGAKPQPQPSSSASNLDHLPLSKKLEIQTALLQADINRFNVLKSSMHRPPKPLDPHNPP